MKSIKRNKQENANSIVKSTEKDDILSEKIVVGGFLVPRASALFQTEMEIEMDSVIDELALAKKEREAGFVGRSAESVAEDMVCIIAEAEEAGEEPIFLDSGSKKGKIKARGVPETGTPPGY